MGDDDLIGLKLGGISGKYRISQKKSQTGLIVCGFYLTEGVCICYSRNRNTPTTYREGSTLIDITQERSGKGREIIISLPYQNISSFAQLSDEFVVSLLIIKTDSIRAPHILSVERVNDHKIKLICNRRLSSPDQNRFVRNLLPHVSLVTYKDWFLNSDIPETSFLWIESYHDANSNPKSPTNRKYRSLVELWTGWESQSVWEVADVQRCPHDILGMRLIFPTDVPKKDRQGFIWSFLDWIYRG